jgi:Domain of unknown function (DUF1918)
MQAEVGHRILVRGGKVGAPSRRGVVLAVRGETGGPPFVVRWDDSPGEHLYYPGSDAVIEGP